MNSALKAMKSLSKRKAVYFSEKDKKATTDQNRMDMRVAGLVPHNQTLNRVLRTYEYYPTKKQVGSKNNAH